MTAGRMAAPMKSTYRGANDPLEGTIPSRPFSSPDARNIAIVLARISLRPGNHLDILEALGVVPTVPSSTHRNAATSCSDCTWVSTKHRNPTLALQVHRRAKHPVTS